jgi:hypothetical protein
MTWHPIQPTSNGGIFRFKGEKYEQEFDPAQNHRLLAIVLIRFSFKGAFHA